MKKPIVLTWSFPWMITYVALLQTMWGILYVTNPNFETFFVLTGAHYLINNFGLDLRTIGILYLLSSLIAVFVMIREEKQPMHVSFLLLLPQWGLMFLSLYSAVIITIRAENPLMENPVDRTILISLLGPIAIAAVLHTLTIIERYVIRWKL